MELTIDGHGLRIGDVVAIGRSPGGDDITMAAEARRRVEATRDLRRDLVARGDAVYGVTTGFGGKADHQIGATDAADLQRGLLAFLGVGTGPAAPAEIVRATMLLRANCLARGHSGVRPEVIEGLLGLLRAGITPVVPVRGSCGASGDLIPLSYVARVLCGTGEAEVDGAVVHAADALAGAGLAPLVLEAKEGLALTNGTSFMSAFTCFAITRAEVLVGAAELTTALALVALDGNPADFDPFIHAQKGHPGQQASAAAIFALLGRSSHDRGPEGGDVVAPGEVRRLGRLVQDRYSIRCAAHVIGVLRDTLTWNREWAESEFNATDDNPLFDADRGIALAGGNFYGGHIAQAMDSLKVAVANIADLADRQLALLVDDRFSHGLPSNLTGATDGLHHGLKGLQLSTSAATAEALKAATAPASLYSRSTESHNQDKVSFGTIAARDAIAVIELTEDVLAMCLLAAAQGAELRGLDGVPGPLQPAHAAIRRRTALLVGDRPLDIEVARVREDLGPITRSTRPGPFGGPVPTPPRPGNAARPTTPGMAPVANARVLGVDRQAEVVS